ncbi:hypothetical protein ACHQM5_013754 [Ranunculus cassubicifolius]
MSSVERDSASSQGVHAESSDSLEPQSTENPVASGVESVTVGLHGPAETLPVQEVVQEPIATVVDEDDGANAQCDADSSVSVEVGGGRRETAYSIEHEEGHSSSIPPSGGESVVDKEELIHSDAVASNSTVLSDSRDMEKESSPSQRLSHDLLTSEDQEADCLGANQCDGRDTESHELQDIEGLETGYIKVEPEEEHESVVSGHGEASKDIAGDSADHMGTEKLTDEGEGVIKGENDSDSSGNINSERTHEASINTTSKVRCSATNAIM